MGFLRDVGLGAATPGSLTSILDPGDLAGTDRARRAKEASRLSEQEQLTASEQAIAETQRATAEAQGFLSPFGDIGISGVEQAGFLTDPNAQFDFLQNNPLFQLQLDNLNQQTGRSSASRGRLSAGDTFQEITNNALLASQPLIESHKQSIGDILNLGTGVARAQANTSLGLGSDVSNLIQNRGNILAGGIAGRNQIQAQTTANQNQLASQAFSLFSDPKLKENRKLIGKSNGFNVWSWDWNKLAKKLGLTGSSTGVMADEVLKITPEAISYEKGFMKVNYNMIGV